MSEPHEPDPVKLISSIFSPDKALIDKVIDDLSLHFGPVDWISPELFFDRTKYYAREMGWPLYRRFLSFLELVPADHLVEIKLRSNEIEKNHLREERRTVNIDPGYISPERLILATGKNYVHRVYLTKGIYADLTLLFQRGSFRQLPWTYKDYSDPQVIEWLNGIRETYMGQRRERKRLA